MLGALGYRVTTQTSIVFLERFFKAARADRKTQSFARFFSNACFRI